jgi:hypothetical protein
LGDIEMLRNIEPCEDRRPNYESDAPKADWVNFLDALGDIANAKPEEVEKAMEAKLGGKRKAKRAGDES